MIVVGQYYNAKVVTHRINSADVTIMILINTRTHVTNNTSVLRDNTFQKNHSYLEHSVVKKKMYKSQLKSKDDIVTIEVQ